MPPSGDDQPLLPHLPSTDEGTQHRLEPEVSASGGPAQYEIRVAGLLDSRWAAWFDDLRISGAGDETVIRGLIEDQAALHGLLAKIRDLGLCLISVRRLSAPD